MYSYYALALLKVSCPWKRYLTQAQLAQFTSVVAYTGCTAYYHYHYTDHAVEPRIVVFLGCCGVQVFEMVSLFILFSIFYKKSYSQKGKKIDKGGHVNGRSLSTKDSEDQCHKAMGDITEATKEVVGTAAKDATKLMATATGVVKRKGGASRAM